MDSSFNKLLNWFLSPKSIYVEKSEPWNIEVFAKSIASIANCHGSSHYKEFDSSVPLSNFKKSDYSEPELKPILELYQYANNNLKEYLVDFLIHGSVSTLDYSYGWSDLDTYLVIKYDVLSSADKLLNLRSHLIVAYNFLIDFDFHQHHGFIIISELDLHEYHNKLLPVEVLPYSKSLFHFSEFKYTRSSTLYADTYMVKSICNLFQSACETGELRHHGLNGIYLEENFNNIYTMYQMKYFLSVVMTLPSYYYSDIGKPTYKKFSFQQIKNDLDLNFELLDKCSKIRLIWPTINQNILSRNMIPEELRVILGPNYFSRAKKFSDELLQSIEGS